VERFDAIVVGAGPAGSSAAHRLASAGASVLLLDRARFPRDKPCGGGLTGRAVRLLPEPVDSVVEDRATRVRLRARYRGGYERRSDEPLVLLTQRSRLDALLAEQAASAGADFRDGVRVDGVDGTAVRLAGGAKAAAEVIIGADGANGVVARSLGLAQQIIHGVALEGNAPYDPTYHSTLLLEFGVVPGGYGWLFPKAEHLNVGVGGWHTEGPRLRDHLARLCEIYGLRADELTGRRGHRLPMRRPGAVLAHGRAAVIGDAAGLVDPFSGDGIYEALLSAKLAAEAALDVLAGRAQTLEPYHHALTAKLAGLLSSSWKLKRVIDRFPRLGLTIVRAPMLWPVIEAVVTGDLPHPNAARGSARIPLAALRMLARPTAD
jgi:geranylgeranyl reductase family protein